MADGEENVGMIRAFIRWITFYRWRKARAILRSADRQFTGSTRGIADAFDIEQDRYVKEFNDYRDAVAQVEAVIEDRRTQLEGLTKEEQDVIAKRDGAMALAERAKEAGDTAGYEKHAAAFDRYDARIHEIDAKQADLQTEIKANSDAMRRHMLGLTKLQGQIQAMPRQKAEAISDFVSSQAIIKLNDRLMGLQSSIDSGPIDAVLKNVKDLKAKARISEKLAGADVRLQDEEYETAGKQADSRSRLDQLLAARKAERDARSGTAAAQPVKVDERPKI